jgi:trk system potassium uptake protein TrkH
VLGAAVITANLLGRGLGQAESGLAGVDGAVKWLGIFGMLASRLEVFAPWILFLPAFRRH